MTPDLRAALTALLAELKSSETVRVVQLIEVALEEDRKAATPPPYPYDPLA